MITTNTSITELMQDQRIKELKPLTFKGYIHLLNDMDQNRLINNFSLRSKVTDWAKKEFPVNKNNLSEIIKELEEVKLIRVKNKKTIEIF